MKELSKLRRTDLNLLVTLRTLLESRNVSRAADDLGLSQPAASHALNRLRDVFQDQLLVRSGRSMVPTPKAEQLLPKIQDILVSLEEILELEDEFVPEASARTFVIATNGYAAQRLLAPIALALQEEAPNVDLRVIASHTEGVRELLAEGRADVALLSAALDMLPEALMMRQLFNDPFVSTVREDHPFVREGVTLESYADARHVLVSSNGEPFGAVDRGLASQGLRRRVALVLPDYMSVPAILHASDYVITTTQSIAKMFGEHSGLAHVAPPPGVIEIQGGLHALWHERVHADPTNQWIRRLILRVAEGLAT